MAVNLRKKYTGNSNISKKNRPYKFQLDYTYQGKRRRETIKDVEFLPSDTREVRKHKQKVVNKLKADLEIELANQSNGIISRQLKKANFIEYFENLSQQKSPNTKTTWENTLVHLISFQGKKLKFEDVTPTWLDNFTKYLTEQVSNNSARTYLQKINASLNQAVKQKILLENPFNYTQRLKKEEQEMIFLYEDEVQKIIDTDFYDNNEIKNSFLFGCYTGLRYSDIRILKWSNIKNIRTRKGFGNLYFRLKNKNIR